MCLELHGFERHQQEAAWWCLGANFCEGSKSKNFRLFSITSLPLSCENNCQQRLNKWMFLSSNEILLMDTEMLISCAKMLCFFGLFPPRNHVKIILSS